MGNPASNPSRSDDDDAVSAMTPPASVQSLPGTPQSYPSGASQSVYDMATVAGQVTTRMEPGPGQPNPAAQSHELPTMIGQKPGGSKPSSPSAPSGGGHNHRFDTLAGQYDSLLPDSAKDYEPKTDTSELEKFLASIRSRIDPNEPPSQLMSEPDLVRAEKIEVDQYTCPLLDQIALIRRLGEGGNGTVFLGYQKLFGEVAVKTLKLSIVQYDASIVSRFFLEARLSKKLSSPHIVKTFDARKEAGLNFLVMEYIHGIDASRYQKQFAKPGQPSLVPEKDALRICISACKGLKMLHDHGVMHRDIKPQNIMIPYGRTKDELRLDEAKLMDLGLAKTDENEAQSVVRHDDDKTVQGTLLGTPGFMSPEQVLDCSSVAAQGDVFSMGATLYCLVCGVPPFREMMGPQATAAATVHSSHVSVTEHSTKNKVRFSRGLITVIEQCLCKKPEERYASASDLLDDMVRVLEGKEPLAKRRPRKLSKNAMWFGVGAAAAVVLAAVFAYKAFSDPMLASHIRLVQQARECVKNYEFDEAQRLIYQASSVRQQSKKPKEKDEEMATRENEVKDLIIFEEKKLREFCAKTIGTFDQRIGEEDFVRADAELNVLKQKPQNLYLPENVSVAVLEGKLKEARDARQARFENALKDSETALGKSDFATAEHNIEIARVIDAKDAKVVQLGKDIQRKKAEAAIEVALKDNGDLAAARERLEDIRKIEPQHPSIKVLADKIELVASVDKELAALQAGTGDLATVTPLLERLPAIDPARTSRDAKVSQARAEFDKRVASVKTHLASNSDLTAAEADFAAAQKIWRSNSELPALQISLDSAAATYDGLIRDIKANFAKDLAGSERKLARARALRPKDTQAADCDALLKGEKTFLDRVDKLASAVANVDKAENFDAVRKEVEDCIAYRKDERTLAAQTQFDTKFKVYQEKVRGQAIKAWTDDLQKLSALGDEAAYDALEARRKQIAAAVPNDPRNAKMSAAYLAKEEKSVIGHARRLVAAEKEFKDKKLPLKDLETRLLASEAAFPQQKAAFANQRELVDAQKERLTNKVLQAENSIGRKKDLDKAQALLDEVNAAYPSFEGVAQAEKELADLKTAYTGELKALGAKLTAGEELEKLDDRIQKCLQMFPRDQASLALAQKMADWKTTFTKMVASITAGGESGNLEEAKKELDKAALLFPSDAQLPKLDKLLKDSTESVQKELPAVEKFLDANVFVERGSFTKASDDVTRFVKRLPSDAVVARVDAKRQKIVKDAEALIPLIEGAVAQPFTVYETMSQARDNISRVEQILPGHAKLAALQQRYAAGKAAYEKAAEAKVQQDLKAKADTKATKTEGPDSF